MSVKKLVLALTVVAWGQSSWALVVPGTADIPTLITFSEVAPLTTNPVISAGGNTVRFGILFQGQTLSKMANGLDDVTPDAPLTLDLGAGDSMTMIDLSSPSFPVLGTASPGTAFLSPLAIRFDNPVNGVAFDLGHLDQAGTVTISAFAEDGSTIGEIQNPSAASDRIVVVEDSGQNTIAGLSIYVGEGEMDWEGFSIDNLGFDDAPGEVIPEPASLIVWGLLLGLAVTGSLKKRWARAV
jgi:hypothetical protein